MLYSYKTQKPAPLPDRIRLDDRSTRTSLYSLSQSELESLGFTGPYTLPTYNEKLEKVIWSSQDLQYQIIPLTQDELNGLAAIDLQEKLDNIDYIGFWNSLIQTPLYNKLRFAATQDLSANTFCTELIALFADAKNNNSNISAIQYYFNILFFIFDFTEEEKSEIETLFSTYNLNAIYTLPDAQFISSHTYDPVTNTIIPNS